MINIASITLSRPPTKGGLEYEIVCASESVAGVRAAISAGIAVGVLPQSSLTDRVRCLSDTTLLADSLTAIIIKTLRTAAPTAREPQNS
jgi:hypothetical protein